MKYRAISLFTIFFFASCTTTSGPGLFTERTPHQKYGKKLADAGLDKTALGAQWFAAADAALTNLQSITVPYKEVGYFAAESPRAAGFRFTAKRGQKLNFNLTRNPSTKFTIYTDLWQLADDGKPSFLQSVDTTKTSFDYEADKDVTLLLRLQPELLTSGEYTLSVAAGPTLGFPVAGPAANIGSFWGNDRDGGARKHEGIDIFTAKGTPAIAAADGRVTSVSVNNLGGNVVFMRPEGKDYNLYYAHLDKQLVEDGQWVKMGDTLGLVGNTGNAKYTVSHLHFGIYTGGGAIDPLPFVNRAVQKPANVIINGDKLREQVRLSKSLKKNGITYKATTIATPLSVSAAAYNVIMPDGVHLSVPVTNVQTADKALKTAKLREAFFLLKAPDSLSARKAAVSLNTVLPVYGYYNDYAFVKQDGTEGWVPVSLLR